MRIRRAAPDDCMTLSEIAHEAKRVWGYPEEWMTRWAAALTVTTPYIELHDVWVGDDANGSAGFYALSGSQGSWELDHFWVRPRAMGRGYGRRLFQHAVSVLRVSHFASSLAIEADSPCSRLLRANGGAARGTANDRLERAAANPAPTEAGSALGPFVLRILGLPNR